MMLSVLITVMLVLAVFLSLAAGKKLFALAIVAVAFLINLVSLLLYYLNADLSRVYITIANRELLVYFFLVISLLLVRKMVLPVGHPVDKIYLFLFVLFVTLIVATSKSLIQAAISGREMVFPLSVYFLFRWLRLDQDSVRAIMRLIILLSVVTAAFAIVEWIYVNKVNPSFWEQIHINGYLAQKYGSFNDPYPGSWINYLPRFIGLPAIFRSIGLMLDPLVTGHFLACGFTIILNWVRGSVKYVFLFLIGIATLFVSSKASFLICFLAIGFRSLSTRKKLSRVMILALVFAVVMCVGILLLNTGDDAFTHYGALKNGVASLKQAPLGHGIGTTGYFSRLVTGTRGGNTSDTTFSVYAYQMGFIGVGALILLIVVPFLLVFRSLWQKRLREKSFPSTLILASLLGAYSILAFSSAAAFSAVPVFTPMMLLGIYIANQSGQSQASMKRRTQVLTRGAGLAR
jgi:hypothetical protein